MSQQRQVRDSGKIDGGLNDFGGMAAPDTPVTAVEAEDDMRALAYSQARAAEIDKVLSAGISSFRRELLPNGRVLAPSELLGWIERTVRMEREEGGPSLWLQDVPYVTEALVTSGFLIGDFELPSKEILKLKAPWKAEGEEDLQQLEPEWRRKEEPRLEHKYLSFVVWQTADIGRAAVRDRQLLDSVRRIATRLVDDVYPWGEDPRAPRSLRELWGVSRAATFVLTGYVPLIRPEQIPLHAGRGFRPQTPKHLQLAVFAAQQRDQSVRARMDAWNQRYPEWAYGRDSAFTSDSSLAKRRLFNLDAESETDDRIHVLPDGEIDISGTSTVRKDQGVRG